MGLLGSIIDGIKSVTVAGFSLTDYEQEKFYRTNPGLAKGYGSVSVDMAFCLTTYLSVIKIISEDVASLPLFVHRTRGDRIDIDKGHPLYALLHSSPNPDMTAIQFREAVTSHALTNGTAFVRVERSRTDPGRVIALWPMSPMTVRRDRDNAGRPVLVENVKNETPRTLVRGQWMEIAGFSIDGQNGLDMLKYMRQAIGLGSSQQEFAARFFDQQQIPPLVLEHPMTTDAPEVKRLWREAHQGAKHWHEPAVLQEGMKASLLQYDMEKAQLNEARAFQLLEICRPYRMPPHKLGDLGRATWANIGSQNTQYYTECLRPWLVRWEQAINKWILGADYPEWSAEHEIAGFLRGDFTQQTEGFRQLLASGVYSINEVRALLNSNPIEGGDEHFIQLNQGTVQNVAAAVSAPGAIRVTKQQEDTRR